ncbi:MAG TPA: preprotein translocase subunit SecG [Patescibacteria group bacterium]|nr:preprotein translocase subunit SecG [Patescibacteria group bacterium]
MDKAINIVQITSALLLILTILLQQRGATLGGAFGGESAVYNTRRGPEKLLFIISIIFAIIFLVSAVINVLR